MNEDQPCVASTTCPRTLFSSTEEVVTLPSAPAPVQSRSLFTADRLIIHASIFHPCATLPETNCAQLCYSQASQIWWRKIGWKNRTFAAGMQRISYMYSTARPQRVFIHAGKVSLTCSDCPSHTMHYKACNFKVIGMSPKYRAMLGCSKQIALLRNL